MPQAQVQWVLTLVWAHTVRACSNLKLTGGVREIWSHIERGSPYAVEAAANLFLGEVKHLGRFPDGITPKPK
jgi:hypothetical protein